MGFQWAQKNISPIGVDLGSDSVKLLQIAYADPPQLLAASSVDVPLEARRDAESHRTFLVPAIKQLIRDGAFKGRRAVVSINAAHTYIQSVRLAKGEESMLASQIEGELRGKLPIDPAGMVIRHVLVGDVFADGGNRQEVICLAASRERVLRQVQTLKAAGLEVVGVHCEPMAIVESFAHLYRRADDVNRTTLFIDIGAATTKVLITHGTQLVFAKAIHLGGDHFTRQLAGQQGVDLAEARLRRIQQASSAEAMRPAEQAPGTVQIQKRQPQGIAAVMETPVPLSAPQGRKTPAEFGDTLDALLDELQLCVGYHRSMFADRRLEKIIFLGGESRHIALCQQIARMVCLPAQLGDPLARLSRPSGPNAACSIDLRAGQPGWAVPMGLCLLPTNL
jgi:type IV pilus assembly protein PilM